MALNAASINGHMEVVVALLAAGAEANSQNKVRMLYDANKLV